MANHGVAISFICFITVVFFFLAFNASPPKPDNTHLIEMYRNQIANLTTLFDSCQTNFTLVLEDLLQCANGGGGGGNPFP